MKQSIIFIAISTLLLTACKHEAVPTVDAKPKSQVSVTNPVKGDMEEQIQLFATSIYLQRNSVTAPVPCFITSVRIKLGDKVSKGDVLYELETKERRALGNQSINNDSTLASFGKIVIKAPSSGIITTLDKQQVGDYVLEGNLLCTVAESQNLAFQLNVPFEFNGYVKQNESCEIILPNKQRIEGKITTELSNMNVVSQTQTYLVKPTTTVFLPENLMTSVYLTTNKKSNTQMLPKECVLSDETMKEFWIMKLINDSAAIKVIIEVGIKNNKMIEILSPVFNTNDRILSDGNYGIADTALVKIMK